MTRLTLLTRKGVEPRISAMTWCEEANFTSSSAPRSLCKGRARLALKWNDRKSKACVKVE